MQLLCSPPSQKFIDALWPKVKDFIHRALVRSNSDYTLDHIYQQLLRGDALLWLAWNGTEIQGVATTEITGLIGTDERVCVISESGGNDFSDCLPFLDELENYARREKCGRMRIYGRRGWIRKLRDRGYSEPWVALEKRL